MRCLKDTSWAGRMRASEKVVASEKEEPYHHNSGQCCCEDGKVEREVFLPTFCKGGGERIAISTIASLKVKGGVGDFDWICQTDFRIQPDYCQ